MIPLLAVIVAFAFVAGCTLTVPGQPTPGPGVTVTATRTATPATTGTVVATVTGTGTATATHTVTATRTATPTRTGTVTGTATPTSTVTPTVTRTAAGPGSISGVKWNDLNGDHRRDIGEPVLANWTIVLSMQEQNGPTFNEVARAVTGVDGAYSFTGLAEGHYRVTEVAQSGWTQTFPTNAEGMYNLVISNGQPSFTGQDFGNTGGTGVTGTTTATVSPTPTATSTATPVTSVTTTPTVTVTPSATVTATGTGTAPTTSTGTVTYFADTLTARNLAFDKSTITVPAGATVALAFINDDAGVPHNFAVYTDSSATTAIFRGAIVTGQVTTTYTFTAPSTPGTYFFRCDVHPTQMTGSFVVT